MKTIIPFALALLIAAPTVTAAAEPDIHLWMTTEGAGISLSTPGYYAPPPHHYYRHHPRHSRKAAKKYYKKMRKAEKKYRKASREYYGFYGDFGPSHRWNRYAPPHHHHHHR